MATRNLTRQLLEEIAELVEEGALSPLPFRSFPACRIDAAFRLMAQGKHIGKVVVAFPEAFVPRRGEPLAPAFAVKPDGCYLITGAFGGFGKVLARWLVECGARHLVLSEPQRRRHSGGGSFRRKTCRARGVDVQVVRADVGSPDGRDAAHRRNSRRAISRLRESSIWRWSSTMRRSPPLTRERMRSVMAPKAYGAWLLHEATRDMDLDCFVMFSSVSSIFGNPAQGNYAAANAFLDALAHHRRALGLPALDDQLGRSRRRRLRGAQRARRRIPRAARHRRHLAGRSRLRCWNLSSSPASPR